MTQGEAIREARIAARMTQEHLAKSAGVSEKTVRRAERSERISAENVRALCACLGLDAATLPQPDGPEAPTVPGDEPEAPARIAVDAPADQAAASGDAPARSAPVGRAPLSHVKPNTVKPIELFLIGAIVCAFTMGVMFTHKFLSQNQAYMRDVDRVAHDPNYVSLAAKAGYRVEVEDTGGSQVVVARCVRSNETGPIPCDPAPRPDGKVGAAMVVIPGNGPPLPRPGSGSGYVCPGMC